MNNNTMPGAGALNEQAPTVVSALAVEIPSATGPVHSSPNPAAGPRATFERSDILQATLVCRNLTTGDLANVLGCSRRHAAQMLVGEKQMSDYYWERLHGIVPDWMLSGIQSRGETPQVRVRVA